MQPGHDLDARPGTRAHELAAGPLTIDVYLRLVAEDCGVYFGSDRAALAELPVGRGVGEPLDRSSACAAEQAGSTCADPRWDSSAVTKRRHWIWNVILVVAGLLVIGAGVAGGMLSLNASGNKSEWGSVSGAFGQWVGGLAAAVAIVSTLFLARHDARAAEARWRHDAEAAEARWKADAEAAEERWRTELRDREEREHRAAERLAQQYARLVLVKAGMVWNSHLSAHEGLVEIANYGPEPVMHPRLESFVHPGGGAGRWEFNSNFDDWTVPGWIASMDSSTIPVDYVHFEPPLTNDEMELRLGWVPIITYQDSAGRRWRRIGTEEPQQRADGDPDLILGPDWYH